MVGQWDAYDTYQPVPRAGQVAEADVELLAETLF